jgi:hypothetical protein
MSSPCKLLLALPLVLWQGAARAETPAPQAPASAPAASSQPTNPGALRIVTPREKLPPLGSVRLREKREADQRSRKGTITVSVSTTPKGAAVYYGKKLLGTTPLSLSAPRGSTPLDVVIRYKGYMTLHSRIARKTSRGYFFKLNPGKLR